jgi:hypothetical protein
VPGRFVARLDAGWDNARLVRLVLRLLVVGALLLVQAPPASADRWYQPQPMFGVIDGSRQLQSAHAVGATWDRVVFLWQEIQPYNPTDWYLDRYLDRTGLRAVLQKSDLPLVAVVQGTPGWAAGNWHDGAAAIPTGLDYPVDDPHNYFALFMQRLVQTYKGRISAWIIWNEPDFQPGQAVDSLTWGGNTADFFSLVRAGYRAVKKVDRNAAVVFPATTYFADAASNRNLFLDRVLQEGRRDPEAARNGYYFDAVGVNLYCSLDAIYRVRGLYGDILARRGLSGKPIWLTETNCPIYNDGKAPVQPHAHITTMEQANFLIQALALARAAGYDRVGWYSMQDAAPSSGIADHWGLLRPDATPRPAYRALLTASRYLTPSEISARLAPLGEPDRNGYPLTRVILDDPRHATRLSVLWRSRAGPRGVAVEASGASAQVLDVFGHGPPAVRSADGWEVSLPPPRVPQSFDPPGFQSSGDPVLLLEYTVPAGAAVTPRLVQHP